MINANNKHGPYGKYHLLIYTSRGAPLLPISARNKAPAEIEIWNLYNRGKPPEMGEICPDFSNLSTPEGFDSISINKECLFTAKERKNLIKEWRTNAKEFIKPDKECIQPGKEQVIPIKESTRRLKGRIIPSKECTKRLKERKSNDKEHVLPIKECTEPNKEWNKKSYKSDNMIETNTKRKTSNM